MGRSLSWDALKSFMAYARPDSALFKRLNPEWSEWSTTIKTNLILADLFDQLSATNMMLHTLLTHKRSRPAQPYKRPGQKKTKRVGKGALASVQDMREWIRQRQVKTNGD